MTDHNREALIERATWALIDYDTDVVDRGVRDEHYRERRADAERVWAVFEQAHTPTGPAEYEHAARYDGNLRCADCGGLMGLEGRGGESERWVHLEARTVQGEPPLRSAWHATPAVTSRRTVQGEPTDAQGGEVEYRVFDREGELWASANSLPGALHYLAQEPGGRIERAIWLPVNGDDNA